jgi:hypothetical protein
MPDAQATLERSRQFFFVRLGRDSVEHIRAIDDVGRFGPLENAVTTSCSQFPREASVGDYAFVWLGSDNDKGAPTAWKQGIRAFGLFRNIDRAEAWNSKSQFTLDLQVVLPESIDKDDLLEKANTLYVQFSGAPIVGLSSFRNSMVQRIAEDEAKQNVGALFLAIEVCQPGFSEQIIGRFPELSNRFQSYPSASTAPAESAAPEASTAASPTLEGGYNLLVYGAPGTGKSRFAENVLSSFPARGQLVRTVFHPDTSHADFFGGLKPVKTGIADAPITYDFIPGPFAKAYVAALKGPEKIHVLLIEELNRANAAGVFGEVFQLLDRDQTGRGEYEVEADSVSENFFKGQLGERFNGALRMPANLVVLATMNSSDQGVQLLDSAFKRRWQFQYMPVDFNACPYRDSPVIYLGHRLSWGKFATTINKQLAEQVGCPEDRLIGPFFLSEYELTDRERIASKLLLYLWEDVLRYRGRESIFRSFASFQGLQSAFLGDKPVFVDAIEHEFTAHLTSTPDE